MKCRVAKHINVYYIWNKFDGSWIWWFRYTVVQGEHMLFLCSIELVQKSPVSLRVNVVPAIQWLNIDCHTNFKADNSWMEFASVSNEKGNFFFLYTGELY